MIQGATHNPQGGQLNRHFDYDPVAATDALFSIAPPEDRSQWIYLAMSAKRAGVTFDDFNEWSRQGQNYGGERECRTDWNALTDHGSVTEATLYKTARDGGWRPSATSISPPSTNTPIRLTKPAVKAAPATNTKAQAVWDVCIEAEPSHPYIARKNGNEHGIRCYPESAPALEIQGQNVAGCLVVPCWSESHLQTLQFIPPHGKKLNLPGATFSDGYHVIGTIAPGNTVYVGEGIGQAWACAHAAAAPAVCTFGAGRARTVIAALLRQYPGIKLVLVSDRGQEGSWGAVAESMGCALIQMPEEKETNYDANDFAVEYGYQRLLEHVTPDRQSTYRYKFLSALDLLNAPPLQWMIRGLFPQTGLAALYGPSGSGKSFLALDLAVTVAGAASEWYGMRVKNCPVVYCVLEGEGGMGKRVQAWQQHHDKALPDALRFVTQPINLLRQEDVDDLAAAILNAGGRNGLVILDTLNRAAPEADENASKDMGIIIAAAKALQQSVGGLVMFVHHTGKQAIAGMRGHSSLFAAMDAVISVTAPDSGPHWQIQKSKDDATGAQYQFTLTPLVVGTDDEGDEVTSCVALRVATPLGLRKSCSLGKHQKAALDALDALFAASQDMQPLIPIDDAVASVAEKMDTGPKHKRERAKEAIAALAAKSKIKMNDCYILPIAPPT